MVCVECLFLRTSGQAPYGAKRACAVLLPRPPPPVVPNGSRGPTERAYQEDSFRVLSCAPAHILHIHPLRATQVQALMKDTRDIWFWFWVYSGAWRQAYRGGRGMKGTSCSCSYRTVPSVSTICLKRNCLNFSQSSQLRTRPGARDQVCVCVFARARARASDAACNTRVHAGLGPCESRPHPEN
jgi:hypothetical protein